VIAKPLTHWQMMRQQRIGLAGLVGWRRLMAQQ
jgi:hypothetical protein